MPWFETHQDVRCDSSILCLSEIMEWPPTQAVGVIHTLRAWCLEHCDSGDLRTISDYRIAHAGSVDPAHAKAFVEALVESGFVERTPYFRLTNWWNSNGRFLGNRYKNNPSVLDGIRNRYIRDASDIQPTLISDASLISGGTIGGSFLNSVTEGTEEHLGKKKSKIVPPEVLHWIQAIWEQYPRKVAKPQGFDAIRKALEKIPVGELLTKTKQFAASWTEGCDLTLCPYPATWFNREGYNEGKTEWDRQAKRTVKQTTVWEMKTQQDAVQKQIAEHVCNPESIKHDRNASQAQRDDYKKLRELEKQLSSDIARFKK